RGQELGSKKPDWRLPSSELISMCDHYSDLDNKLTSTLHGREKLTDAAELLEMFDLCISYKKDNVAAVQLYAEAVNVDPKLAENFQDGNRYKAACAAVLAAGGKGNDVAGLQPEEIVHLRRLAFAWLNADLAAWTKLSREAADSESDVRQTLDHWK